MPKLDTSLKTIWLIIGVAVLAWLGFVRVPLELRMWKARQVHSRRVPSPRSEPGIIVGAQAEQDKLAGVRRQGLRYGPIIDPLLAMNPRSTDSASMEVSDWLLVPVTLATYSKPAAFDIESAEYIVAVKSGASDYTWKQGREVPGYSRAFVHGVNIVFYRRDGSASELLLRQPAWISSVLLPKSPGGKFYYEMALSDTNGDDRIDQGDRLTLWVSETDGSALAEVWMPAGQVEPTLYSEPLSGDMFGTLVEDTDRDGSITEYDQPTIFRMAVGDTIAKYVVSDELASKLREIVFGTSAGRTE